MGLQTGGHESLRDGKSLFLFGHVTDAQYHGISGNVLFCFIRAEVVHETTLTAAPYSAWILTHK